LAATGDQQMEIRMRLVSTIADRKRKEGKEA
jgi:hypothetical protein